MKLKEIMSPNVEAVSKDVNVSEAARRMAAQDIGFLPVIDETEVVGVVTDRDIACRAVAEGKDLTATPVSEIMTSHVEFLTEDAEVEEAAQMMQKEQIRRVLVRDADGRYVGVVSLGDLALHIRSPELSGQALERISQPA